jgi:phage FluMu gp28-like protein
LYLGVDVGRTRDRTVIWTLELVGDVAWTREIRVLDNAPFALQKGEIVNRISRDVVAVRIDKGAIGFQLAEELELQFPHIVLGVQLTQGRQGQLALALKTAFERSRIRIPEDPMLQNDLQLVQEVETGASGIPVIETHRGETGHADRFWAGALALSGLPLVPRSRLKGIPRGRRSSHAG